MEEKRKNKRLDLDVNVQLERLDEDGVTTLKFVHVDVTDISKSGIGFDCKKKLEMNSYYDAKIQIWTKEVVDAVIQIVRSEGRVRSTFLKEVYKTSVEVTQRLLQGNRIYHFKKRKIVTFLQVCQHCGRMGIADFITILIGFVTHGKTFVVD